MSTLPLPPVAPLGPALPMLAVISNAGSTQNLAAAGWVDAVLAGEENVINLPVSGPVDIAAAYAKALAMNAAVVVVNGGDGTADLVMTAALTAAARAAPPAMALLAAGKTNMTAAAWSFGGDKAQALKRILALRRDGALLNHIRRRHVLRISREGEADLRGAFFGAADIVDGILFCRRHIYPMNLPNALSHPLAIGLLLWRAVVRGAAAAPLSARWDNTSGEDGRFFLVSATTLDTLITGLTPVPEAGDGPMTYISLRPGLGPLLSVMPKLITKDIGAGRGRHVRNMRTLTLAFDGAFTLDGELFEARKDQPVTISADETLPMIRMDRP